MTPSRCRVVQFLWSIACFLAAAPFVSADTTYTWNDSTTDWTNASAWTPSGPTWTSRSQLDDAIAEFGPQVTIANTPTIGSSTIYVKGITIDNAGGAAWNINGTGRIHLGSSGLTVSSGGATETSTIAPNVTITAAQTWNIDSENTVTLSSALAGGYELTQDGAGTLTLTNTGNTFFGGFTVNAGTLTASGATAITNAFRANRISLSPDATFIPGASSRFGALDGAGTVSNGSSTAIQTLLTNETFSGTITNGVWEVRGAGTQAFSGNTSALNGIVRVYGVWSGAAGETNNGLTLSGSSALTGASVSMLLRGGTFTMDNSGTNIADRLRDAGSFFVQGGGVLKYIGFNSASDITESLNDLTSTARGMIRIDVSHGGGTGKTILNFDTFAALAAATQHVLAAGGAGVLDGTGAKVTFTTAPAVNNGVVAAGAGNTDLRGSIIATSSGVTNFATYDATNGVVPISPTALSGAFSTTNFDNVEISSAATADTSGGYLGRNTVTFRDGGSLDISGSNHFGAYSYLHSGSGTVGITSSGGGQLAGGPDNSSSASTTANRFFIVTDPAGLLSVTSGLAGANAGVTKSGDGTLALTGSSNQLNFTTAQTIHILQGTLRGTTTALGGSASSGGTFTEFRLHGGVLEIDGEGSLSAVSFSRALVATGGTNLGGGILWTASASQIGSGGFSAINAPGGVDVTLVTSIGGSTASTLTFNSGAFVASGFSLLFGSRNSDSRVTLTNDIQLDAGSITGYEARPIHVYDNTASTGDYARLSGNITGSVSADLLKTGAGTLELTGNNTYGGNTLIHGGTLWANNTTSGQSSTGSGTVVVMNGGTLGGRGNIGGSIFAQSGGTVAPGDITSSIATLTVGNGAILDTGSAFNVAIEGATAGSGYDQLKVTGGDVVLAGTLNATFSTFTPDGTERIFVIDNTGTGALSGTFSNYAASGALVTNYGGFDWRIYYGADANAYNGSDGNDVVLVPVPEPGSILLVCAAAGGLGYAARKRWRRRAAPSEPAA